MNDSRRSDSPYVTLPTLEELKRMDALTAYMLYHAEIQRLPHLSREETAPLVERARQGDPIAREQLMLNCQTYAFLKAVALFVERAPGHIDVLDLVGVANLAIVEGLEKAISKSNAVAYLMTIAVRKMQQECIYRAPMIQRPVVPLEKLEQLRISDVESLDTPVYRDNGEILRVDQIEGRVLTPQLDERKLTHRFAPLYEAVKNLPPLQRATIIRTHGFFGQPAETTEEISTTDGTTIRNVLNNGFLARRNLRRMLEEHLDAMLSPQPEDEKE